MERLNDSELKEIKKSYRAMRKDKKTSKVVLTRSVPKVKDARKDDSNVLSRNTPSELFKNNGFYYWHTCLIQYGFYDVQLFDEMKGRKLKESEIRLMYPPEITKEYYDNYQRPEKAFWFILRNIINL